MSAAPKFTPGLTEDEAHLLALVGTLRPWGNRKTERAVGRYLDGAGELIGAPALRGTVSAALAKAAP